METREIGSVTEIDIAELRLVYHRAGNAGQEAVMLKELLDRGLKQSDIAKLLETHQAQISRKLKLLQLTPALFQRVVNGEIKARTGYQLARLPKEKQAEFESSERVTMKSAEEEVRRMVLNADVISLIKDFEEEPTNQDHLARCPHCGGSGRMPEELK